VVLPAYYIERAPKRLKTAAELEYRLKPTESQGCVFTEGRLLAWEAERNRIKEDQKEDSSSNNEGSKTPENENNRESDTQNGTNNEDVAKPNNKNKADSSTTNKEPQTPENKITTDAEIHRTPGGIRDGSNWYSQIKGRPSSFFMGLARVSDLCTLWVETDNEQKEKADNCGEAQAVIKQYVKDIEGENSDGEKWIKWLRLNDRLFDLEEKYRVIPARLIGEIFVFLYNQWKENVVGIKVEEYVNAFWYSLLSWEMAWRSGKKWPSQPKGTYTEITIKDVMNLLDHTSNASPLPHSIVWMMCPLFEKEFDGDDISGNMGIVVCKYLKESNGVNISKLPEDSESSEKPNSQKELLDTVKIWLVSLAKAKAEE
jgi:hypothetical protein